MFHLLLAACLQSDPTVCATRLLPAADAATQNECLSRGESIAKDWAVRHKMVAKQIDCVPSHQLDALEVTEIAPGVFVSFGDEGPMTPANQGRIANLGFIIGETVAVVDAGVSADQGEALYAAIRQHTDLPISHLILTHMHPDHVFGAEVFAEAGASIVANAKLAEGLAMRTSTWLQTLPPQIGEGVLTGTAISPVDRGIAEPTRIELGNRALWLTPVATAHTDNDLTVFDEGSRVLFTGDLVQSGLTPSVDGSVTGWINWLKTAPSFGPEGAAPLHYIPGHGPAFTDWTQGSSAIALYLTTLRDAVQKLVQNGTALSAAIPETVTAMQGLAPAWQDFDAVTARNAATVYSELEWQ